ncbi:MAG: hypothetical protein CFE29_03570 [Bradyrhizobiaceae bacterium PARB1]|jgi:hypothetical protein|nr:MAG: hypothetical protein CFE29_03570 [Bradyrhizobiaceae bacterium PARB1]
MESREVSFVTWPDGKVDNASLTVAGEQMAREKMINQWLPAEWFGRAVTGYVADTLWRGMTEKGFRSHTIKIGEDGLPALTPQ